MLKQLVISVALVAASTAAAAQTPPTLRNVPTGIDVPGCAAYVIRDGNVIQICDAKDFRRWKVTKADAAWFMLTPQGNDSSTGGSPGGDPAP